MHTKVSRCRSAPAGLPGRRAVRPDRRVSHTEGGRGSSKWIFARDLLSDALPRPAAEARPPHPPPPEDDTLLLGHTLAPVAAPLRTGSRGHQDFLGHTVAIGFRSAPRAPNRTSTVAGRPFGHGDGHRWCADAGRAVGVGTRPWVRSWMRSNSSHAPTGVVRCWRFSARPAFCQPVTSVVGVRRGGWMLSFGIVVDQGELFPRSDRVRFAISGAATALCQRSPMLLVAWEAGSGAAVRVL